MRSRRCVVPLAAAALLALPTSAAGHGDHNVPASGPSTAGTATNMGGPGAKWEHLRTFTTQNPHTDLDFFTKGDDTYVSVGTLAYGGNAAGQTILRLTEGGAVNPTFVAGHPSAKCAQSKFSQSLYLQHDVEATPKGDALLNEINPYADRRDAQLLLDATDSNGRCHDYNGSHGGIEIIDITNVSQPVEIGLTSHIGQAHTVNVDPKRPHIAYAVTSDFVTVNGDARTSDQPSSSLLDGFELIDLTTCMDFPAGTSVETKRRACRPQVYRYRYEAAAFAYGHSSKAQIGACHELEVYASELLTCASMTASIVFDMRNAFDDNNTPNDFTDDKPRGVPLPCEVRPSMDSLPDYLTDAEVTDCTRTPSGGPLSLNVARWKELGAPSLENVRYVGTIHHQGADGPWESAEEVAGSHEAELSGSGELLIVSDERGGGVSSPGSSCDPAQDLIWGNGGLHAYRFDRLSHTTTPGAVPGPERAWEAYARTPAGRKAVYRAPVRTSAQTTLCTSHVFQLVPGQNRIFMGWYSQGTQVLDIAEYSDGTVEFKDAGWFIPEGANHWVSHVFKMEENHDGSWTYWGAAGDFSMVRPSHPIGRNAIEIYKVTLPPPPAAGQPPPVPPPPPPAEPQPTPQPPPPPPPQTTPQPQPSGVPQAQPKAVVRTVRGRGTLAGRGRLARGPRFSIDLTRPERGKLVYTDPRAHLVFRSTRLNALRFGARFAILRGLGTRNGRRVRYEVVVTDGGAARNDRFSIRLSSGYQRFAALRTGDIVVR